MSTSQTNGQQLTEQLVQDSFHGYLKLSLSQAKAEGLLGEEILSSAEGDLMITGPALCLYFAALRSTTNPPSVPLCRASKHSNTIDLSFENCPSAFISFLHVWSQTVPTIKALPPELQHDLARIICSLQPITNPSPVAIKGIAADLRAVAIEISQRRSFQNRYASDLQAALDSGNGPSSPTVKASFVPPPLYDPSPNSPGGGGSPYHAAPQLPPPNINPAFLSPPSPNHSRTPSSSSSSGFPSRSPSPTILAPDSPAIEFIRETLYASLADALERQPSLRALLKYDPPRAYFASVSFAILDVATNAVTPDGAVIGVLGTPLTLEQCPKELLPFMMELASIGREVRVLEEEDTRVAMKHAQRGEEIPLPRMDRVRVMLEEGIGGEMDRREANSGRRSVRGRAIAFMNRINALSLGLTRLKAFRERQDDVFKVLAGIGP